VRSGSHGLDLYEIGKTSPSHANGAT
jgi:hypothetical protein